MNDKQSFIQYEVTTVKLQTLCTIGCNSLFSVYCVVCLPAVHTAEQWALQIIISLQVVEYSNFFNTN